MKLFYKTKRKIFGVLAVTLSFLFCGIIGIYQSVEYSSIDNISQDGVTLTATDFGTEIDQIFNTLEIYSQRGEQSSPGIKAYSKQEYIRDLQILGGMFFILSMFLFFLFHKFLGKLLTPLEEDYEDLHNFIENASHELKTPLTVIDSGLWVMKEKKSFDENLIGKLQGELGHANGLIESLRDLSNITIASKTEEIEVGVCIQEILLTYDVQIQKRGLKVELNVIDDFSVSSNREYLQIFLSNIVGNAIKYNVDAGDLKITVVSDKIVIEDTGIGIPEEKLDKLFNRFYRVKEHRGREGLGLGLSLVKKIADTYSWDIKILSKEEEGTKFIVKFR